ncbi:membrane protein insertase YidC [Candidatus Woesebacteria bacterium]|nr:membrane protein insertase YidC [Candidatus Woesebacteria bacterium]
MNIFEVLLLQPLANGLVLFYRVLGGNMGLAIIAFSVFLRFILTPLTRPYMESMKKMKSYQKDLEKIKKRHKGDRPKFMKAQADFYKEKGINPSAGCLPYLLQIVVLIAFFNVFSRVLAPDGDVVSRFNELLYEPLKFAQDAIINTKFLYLDITKPDTISGLVPIALPGPFLILAAAVQFLSAKISAPYIETEKKIAQKTKGEADDIGVAMQQSMVYTFPLITLLVGINFASGLVLYWLVFSALQAYQQYRSSGWGGLTPWVRRLNLVK